MQMDVKNLVEPFSDAVILFLTHYTGPTKLCPHCPQAKAGLRLIEDRLPDEKRPIVIYADSEDPRLWIHQKIAQKLKIEGRPMPLLYAKGNVYLGHKGKWHYAGLLTHYLTE
jgi:glutaredoxin